MNWFHAVILGIVEGITEFLPVSSTGHLTVVERLLGYNTEGAGMTAFTAIIQVGAIIAAVLYFWKDIVRIVVAWFKGLANKAERSNPDYTLGWGVIVASIPVAVVGLAAKSLIEGPLRSLWVVAIALIVWSFALWAAQKMDTGRKTESDITVKDSIIIGLFQALSPLFPGLSRSGTTISAGLILGYDRVTATRLSFFMGIPALVAAGALEAVTAAGDVSTTVGWGPTLIATAVSFVVAYATIAWLLKFVSSHNFNGFIVYRILLGLAIIGLLAGGVVTA